MIKKGVYAAGLMPFNEDCSLNIEGTINLASSINEKRVARCIFFRFYHTKSTIYSNSEKV